jgi:hypothetical protein
MGGLGTNPLCGDHRQPEREGRSKGKASNDPQGFDVGKTIVGRKRHILVDTLELLLGLSVLPANIQDRDGAHCLLQHVRRRFLFITRIFADAGYQGPKMARAVAATRALENRDGQMIQYQRLRRSAKA